MRAIAGCICLVRLFLSLKWIEGRHKECLCEMERVKKILLKVMKWGWSLQTVCAMKPLSLLTSLSIENFSEFNIYLFYQKLERLII